MIALNYLAIGAVLIVSAGCSSSKPPARPDSTRIPQESPLNAMLQGQVLGVVSHFGDGPDIRAPSTARVGEAIPVTVTTYGGGCIREDTTIVAVDSLSAEISPYQRIPTGPATCTMELLINRRALLITFAVPGRATIKINGRSQPGDSAVTLFRTLLVQ